MLRRSQLLDAALYRDDLAPIFMNLSEKDQARIGNAFMRHLASEMDPENPFRGQRRVIELMEVGERLSDYLGSDLEKFLPARPTLPLKPASSAGLGGSPR